MTVLVFDPASGKVLVDSCHSFTNGMKPVTSSKIVPYKGAKFAYSGADMPIGAIESLVFDLIESKAYTRAHETAAYDGIAGFARFTDDQVYQFWFDAKTLYAGPAPTHYVLGFGIGAAWFYAYLSDGATVAEAMHKTAVHHVNCGLPVEQF